MPNKNNKNCIIDIEITKCEQKPQLVGLKFTAISMMQFQQTISRQAKRSSNKKRNKDKKVQSKTRITVQDLYMILTSFMQEMREFKQEINQKVDQFKQEVKQEIAEIKQQIQATNQKVDLLEQKVNRGFKQVNARIDNLVAKNKLVE